MDQKLIIGLTGGIGSGKSTVGNYLRDYDIVVVDDDQCSRVVVEKGQPALMEIAEHFGPSVPDHNGELDRAKLRTIIFSNNDEKKWLEALLHPLIFTELWQQLSQATSPYVVLESPLLIESGQLDICHRILVVDIDEETQILRASERDNVDQENIRKIIASQTSRENRLEHASDVIENNQTPEQLEVATQQLHEFYLSLSQQDISQWKK